MTKEIGVLFLREYKLCWNTLGCHELMQETSLAQQYPLPYILTVYSETPI
jgi:hypothetical protein